MPLKSFFQKVFFLIIFLIAWSASAVSAGVSFDNRKLGELQNMQVEALKEEDQKAKQADAAEKVQKKPTKKQILQPSQPGITLVPDSTLARSEDIYRESLKVITKKKGLLERLDLILNSTLNYDSNIFNEKPARGDFYYTVGPLVRLDATDLYKQLGGEFSYQCIWNQYFSFARLNRLDHFITMDFPGHGRKFRIGKKTTLEVYGGFSVSGDNDSLSPDNGSYVKQIQPYAGTKISYLLSSKFSTDFEYKFNARRTGGESQTESSDTLDLATNDVTVYENTFSNRLRYHYTPKTSVFVGCTLGFSNSSGGSTGETSNIASYDSNYGRVTGGIEGKLTPKSVISLESGWEHRTFKTRSSSDGLYLQGAYLVQLTRKLSAQAFLIRDMAPSLDANTGFYTSNIAKVTVNYNFTNRFVWSNGTSFQINQTQQQNDIGGETTNGKDYTFSVDTSLRYYMNRWVALQAAYQFSARNASQSINDYVEHLATIGVTLGS